MMLSDDADADATASDSCRQDIDDDASRHDDWLIAGRRCCRWASCQLMMLKATIRR